MPELCGTVAFLAAVGLISYVVWKVGISWRRADRLIKAIVEDSIADPDSDIVWRNFEAAERGDHRA